MAEEHAGMERTSAALLAGRPRSAYRGLLKKGVSMKVLLVSTATPDTFWSFKHVLPFVFRRAPLYQVMALAITGHHFRRVAATV